MRLLPLLASFLLATSASAADKAPPRVAVVVPATAAFFAPRLAKFKKVMAEEGLVEGKHYTLDVVYAGGDYTRFPELTREVLQRNPAAILVSTIESVRVAQQQTKTVPSLMSSVNDPVGNGLVASLARPGGNTTGLSTLSEDTIGKYVELVRETLPRAKRVAVLMNPGNPSNLKMMQQALAAGKTFGMEVRDCDVSTPASLDAAYAAIAKYRPDALLVLMDAMIIAQPQSISQFALKSRIPAFGPTEDFVTEGSLLSYTPSLTDIYRRSAAFVGKILSGAKPADLPIEQPTKFELVVNAKTAKTLGLKFPQSIVQRVDKVIE